MGKRLSIIIITWNEKDILSRCLDSINDGFDFVKDEIIVVDNGSTDGTASVIEAKYPNVQVLKLDKNYGVGPARNRGLAYSTGRYLMTLDNDTIIENNEKIGDLVDDFFLSKPDAGVLGFKLLNIDGTFQQSCRRFPGWLQPFSARIHLLRYIPLFKNIHSSHMMEDVDFDNVQYPYEVDYVLGANQIYRRELFAELGGYDPFIFFGPEDFDFCYRAKIKGYKNFLSNEFEIIHDYQRRTRKLNIIMLKHIKSFYYVMRKNNIKHL